MNIKHFIVLGALLSIVACTHKMNETDVPFPTGELTFDAVFGDGQNTKTVIKNETEVWWSPNDAISVFYGNLTSGKFTSTISEASATSKFTGTLSAVTGTIETENESQSFWAVYPYDAQNSCDGNTVTLTVPVKQRGAEGTFARKTFPAIAMSTGLDLAFYNVCGGIVFTVTRDDIRAMTFSGNNDENIAGTINVAFEEGLPAIKQVVNGEKSITFRSPDNKPFVPGSKYFITAIPGTFSQGFKMVFLAANGDEGMKEINESKTINRSRFLVMNDVDAGVEFVASEDNANLIHFVDFDLKDKLVAAFDTDSDGELSFDEAAAVESAQDIIAAIGGEKSYQSFDEFQYFTRITSIPNSMFKDWVKMTSIILPSGLTQIGEYSFANCSNIEALELPDGVIKIGSYAFSACGKLSSIIFPEGLTVIGEYSFDNCSSLQNIIIPSSVTKVGADAFRYCKALSSVSIHCESSAISSFVFQFCSGVSSVSLNSIDVLISLFKDDTQGYGYNLPWMGTDQSVHLYVAGEEVKSLSMPEGVSRIPNGAFRRLAIKSISIPEGVAIIGNGAFENCDELTTVNMPSSITSIGYSAFYNCKALTDIELNEGLASIDFGAFENCSSLSSFVFPASIKKIGNSVLSSCRGLSSITVKAVDVPTGGTYMFSSSDCPIYVPEESVDAYKAAANWSTYASRIMPIMAEGDDPEVSDNVIAKYLGSSAVVINGIIQSGSKLNYGVYNNSSKPIKVLTIQLVDGVSGQVGNMMTVNKEIEASANSAWTITLGSAMQAPTAIFVYSCEGKRYETRVAYSSN